MDERTKGRVILEPGNFSGKQRQRFAEQRNCETKREIDR